jgi:hypothetical protein
MTDEEFAQQVIESFHASGRNGVEEAIGNWFLHDWREVDDQYVTLIINLIRSSPGTREPAVRELSEDTPPVPRADRIISGMREDPSFREIAEHYGIPRRIIPER